MNFQTLTCLFTKKHSGDSVKRIGYAWLTVFINNDDVNSELKQFEVLENFVSYMYFIQ